MLTSKEFDGLCAEQDSQLLKVILPKYVEMRTALMMIRGLIHANPSTWTSLDTKIEEIALKATP